MPGRVYTDAGKWANAVRRAAQQAKDKPFLAAIRRGLKPAREMATKEFLSTGIGRSVFGPGKKAKKGAFRQGLIGMSVRRPSENVFEGALKAKGLAALVETGGRTKDHPIKARAGGFLVFQATGRSGFLRRQRTGLVAVRAVKHPGGAVHKRPLLRQAVERAAPKIRAEISRVWTEVYARVVG